MSVEEADNICFDYSNTGGNLPQAYIMNKYKLNRTKWSAVKNYLELYKYSPCVSQYTYNTKDEDQILAESEIKHQDSFREKSLLMKNKVLMKKSIEAVQKLEEHNLMVEDIEKGIQKAVASMPIRKLPRITFKNMPRRKTHISCAITDIHLGKKNEKEVIERLKAVFSHLASLPHSNIHLFILGDIFENLVESGMHSGQVEYGMDANSIALSPHERIINGADLFS